MLILEDKSLNFFLERLDFPGHLRTNVYLQINLQHLTQRPVICLLQLPVIPAHRFARGHKSPGSLWKGFPCVQWPPWSSLLQTGRRGGHMVSDLTTVGGTLPCERGCPRWASELISALMPVKAQFPRNHVLLNIYIFPTGLKSLIEKQLYLYAPDCKSTHFCNASRKSHLS